MARILLYGTGDLGEKAAYLLAAFLEPGDELVLAGRRAASVGEVADMARMVARGRRTPLRVTATAFPLEPDRVYDALTALKPDVVLFMATHYTWWRAQRLPASTREALDRAGFAAWLPCHAELPLQLVPVLRALDAPPWLVLAPYPDLVAPLVFQAGYPRVIGFGNVDELAMMAEEAHPGSEVCLVAHHSVEAALFAGRALPPHRLAVGDPGGSWSLAPLTATLPWPSGSRSHFFTASSLVRTLGALLGDTPTLIHIPGPLGLPGGYPCRAGGGTVTLALPPDLSREEAVRLNEEAAVMDGIAGVDPDGTVHLTVAAQEGLRTGLGLQVDRWAPADLKSAAAELVLRARRWETSQPGPS